MTIPPAIPTAGANVPFGPQSSAPIALSRHRLSWLRDCDIRDPAADDRKQVPDKYPALSAAVQTCHPVVPTILCTLRCCPRVECNIGARTNLLRRGTRTPLMRLRL